MVLRMFFCSVRVTANLDIENRIHHFNKLTNRKYGCPNRKIAYKCLLIAMPGNLIILENAQVLLPNDR